MFKDQIWATRDIFAKIFLLACIGIIFELTLHVLILFMLEKSDNFIFFIGSKMLIVFS